MCTVVLRTTGATELPSFPLQTTQSEAESRLRILLGRRHASLVGDKAPGSTPCAALEEEQQRSAVLLAKLQAEESAARKLLLFNTQLKNQLLAERRRARSAERACDDLRRELRQCTHLENSMQAAWNGQALRIERTLEQVWPHQADARISCAPDRAHVRQVKQVKQVKQEGWKGTMPLHGLNDADAALQARVREALLISALAEMEQEQEVLRMRINHR